MDDDINAKLQSLMKYLPFIDFILKIDEQKYYKFNDIKKWIVAKKRYPLKDLEKIEQSITTQYKNLLLVKKNIPQDIIDIFDMPTVCISSGDEREYEKENNRCKKKKDKKSRSSSNQNHTEKIKKEAEKHSERRGKSTSSLKQEHKQTTKVYEDDDDDDDLQIIETPSESNQVPNGAKTSVTDHGKTTKKDTPKKEFDLDDQSAELLRKIDILNEDDNKLNNYHHEPINYNKHSDDDDDADNKAALIENLFQRRKSDDLLFKRREDFKGEDDIVVKEQEAKTKPKMDKQHKSDKTKRRNSSKSDNIVATVDTILLDSSSSSENEEENRPSTSAKALKALLAKTSTANNKTGIEKGASNKPEPLISNTVANNLNAKEMSIDVNSSLNNAKPKETQTINRKNKTTLIENSAKTSTNSNNSLDDAVIDLLDMDIDTENDLNDVLNEIENSTELTTKTTKAQSKETPIFRNPSPPLTPQTNTKKSVDNTSNTLHSVEPQTTPSSTTSSPSYNNLTQEELLNIVENIQSKSDFEIDKLLKTLSSLFNDQHSPSNLNAINPNDVAPPAPHVNPVIPSPIQHTPVQLPQLQQQQQQPMFYPNPMMPTQMQPTQMQTTQMQQAQSMYHHHHAQQQLQYPPQHRYGLNLNDPRIVKNLNLIYKSAVWSELNRQTAGNLINHYQQFNATNYQQHPQQHHPQHPLPQHPLAQHQQHNSSYPPQTPSTSAATVSTPAPINIRRKSGTKTTICYGDYKRRQLEQQEQLKRQLEEEKQRKEAELKAKQAEEAKAREQREYIKQTDEIRSILQSTLEPYKEKISEMWEKQNQSTSSKSKSSKKDKETSKEPTTKEATSTNSKSQTKNVENPLKTTSKVNSSKSLDAQKQINNKINRIHKELECTFKGFDQLLDYVPKTIGGRRRSSIHARTAILEQLNSEQPTTDYSEQSDINSSQPKSIGDKRRSSLYQSNDNTDSDLNSTQSLSNMPTLIDIRRRSSSSERSLFNSAVGRPKPIGPKRRSSIFARSAIEEQLRQQNTTDNSDSDFNISSQSTTDKETYTSRSLTKRRQTIDEPIQAKRRVKSCIIRDDESTLSICSSSDEEVDTENISLKESALKKQAKVVLKRLSDDFIKKHSSRKVPALKTSDVLNIHLVESAKPVTREKPPNPPIAKKITKLKKLNNDCQMTERNTRFCVLCTSKPSDLTNHYLRKHKTESYVSRLSYSKLEDLELNTHFAKLQSGKLRSKYLVECPFCDEEVVEPFMELYDHYSFHTGEFAYHCGHCQLEKPFRSDITAHQKRSKTCRNTTIRVLYRYPPKSHCIYLHYCIICNFVQLNEANVLKHLREHHSPRDAVAKNVCKCILAAISDAPDINDKPEIEPAPEKTVLEPASEKTVLEPAAEKTVLEPAAEKTVLEPLNVSPIKEVRKSSLDFKVDDDDIPVNNEACSEDIYEEGRFSLEELLQKMHEEPTTSRAPMTVIHCGDNSANINANIAAAANDTNNIAASPLATAPPTAPAPAENVTQRHLPMIIKVEPHEFNESALLTPPRSTTSSVAGSTVTESAAKNDSSTSNRNPQVTLTPNHSYSSVAVRDSSTSVIINYPSTDPSATQQKPKLYPVYEKYHTYPSNVNYLGLYKCMADDCYYSTDSSDEILKHLNDHSQDCLPTEYLHCPYCTISENIQVVTATQLIEHISLQHQHMIYQCSICCYRSCEASNVTIHQQQVHADATNLQIFKCSGTEVERIEQESYFNEKILENVRNITCPYCSSHKYYNTHLMKQHISQYHKRTFAFLKVYSCIYCEHFEREQNDIRKHVSVKHPEELPYIYDHNTFLAGGQDTNNYSNISYLAETVDYVEVKPVCDSSVDDNLMQDIKPALEDLIKMNEDTVKIRLRKLTTHTGVPPDSLYRCPEPTCGGFFSVYDLWLKHMRVRHRCLECQCPHCTIKIENNEDDNQHSIMHTLESFKEHFEEHRRHIFICFHCSTTMRNEDMAKQHAAEQHSNLGTMRFEQIRFNINYSYFIIIQTELFNEREVFINELLTILDKRLKDLESLEMQKLKHRWLIQENASWLEDFPKYNLNDSRALIKCVVPDCKLPLRDDELFNHLNATHAAYSSNFNCKKCDQWVAIKIWNDLSDHLKLHTEDTIFICVACLHTNACRIKLSEHIREQHAARDVPVLELIRTCPQTTYIKLAVVFANNQLTFSTIRNCFCCSEMRMSGDAFNLHLRRYHKLTLNYFCEWCTNTQFKSLDEVKGHFQNSHATVNIKIRCELASNSDLIVISLNEFQVSIVNEQQQLAKVKVKEEPNDQPAEDSDDDVILLEDDDIAIQESLRNQQSEKPKLKCINMNNLLQAPSTASTSNVPQTPSSASTSNVPQTSSTPNFLQTPSTASTSNVPQTSSTPNLLQTPLPNNFVLPPSLTITKIVDLSSLTTNTTPTTSAHSSVYSSTTLRTTTTTSTAINTLNIANINNLPSTSAQAYQINNNNVQDTKRRKIAPANVNPVVHPNSCLPNHTRPPASTQTNSFYNSTTTSNAASNVRPIPSIITQNNTRVNTPYSNNSLGVNSQYNVSHRVAAPIYNVNSNIRNNYNFVPQHNTPNYNVNPGINTHYHPTPNVNNRNFNTNNYALPNQHQNHFHT